MSREKKRRLASSSHAGKVKNRRKPQSNLLENVQVLPIKQGVQKKKERLLEDQGQRGKGQPYSRKQLAKVVGSMKKNTTFNLVGTSPAQKKTL